MESFCECQNFNQTFNEMISIFLKSYGKFLKIQGKNIINKKAYNEMQNEYDVLISLTKSIQPKGDETLTRMKNCINAHTKEISEINTKISKSEELLSKINSHYDKIKKEIPSQYEEEEDEDEKDNIKNSFNNIINTDKPIEEMTDEEIMERDKKTIVLVQDLLNDAEFKAKKKEDKKEIMKIKNQLKDIVNSMEVELNNNDEQIDVIENTVLGEFEVIEKGNENLQHAAQDAIKRRRLKYQLGLAGALGAAGCIIPGIGKYIGAALGGLIGYGAYRIDKHRLNKIEKKREKEKKEKEKEKNKENEKDKKKDKKK